MQESKQTNNLYGPLRKAKLEACGYKMHFNGLSVNVTRTYLV